MKIASATHKICMSHVISALSHALDLTEGQPLGHCIRSCWIGLNIAMQLDFNKEQLIDLYYTILLKDAGCSSNSSRLYEIFGANDISNKRDAKLVDIQNKTSVVRFVLSHIGKEKSTTDLFHRVIDLAVNGEKLATELVAIRCERGAEIAQMLGLTQNVSSGIYSLDEHWNGKGRPKSLSGNAIPVNSRIALLSQVADVFNSYNGPDAALSAVTERSGKWFDPDIVEAFKKACEKSGFWSSLVSENLEEKVEDMVSDYNTYEVDEDGLDQIALAFARIIDAKSPYTAEHSKNITNISNIIAREMGLDQQRCRWIKRGALLHDIGKLGVSNEILDKPGKLSDEEFNIIKMHPVYTEQILSRFKPFREMAIFSAAHHERLDGKGYPRGLKGDEISLETRIISVSDIFHSLIEDRPYRKAMTVENALKIMENLRGSALDTDCLDILIKQLPKLNIN